MTEQSQRGATQNFRTARVFDGSGTDGRPHVDRQMLDEREASQVLSYLEAAPVVHTTNGLGLDRIDPMRGKAVPLTWLTDGSWVWPGSVSYYLSNYALPPDPELLTHIRRRNFRPPTVDAATRQAAVKAVAGRPPADPPSHAPVAPAASASSVFTPTAGAAGRPQTTSGPLARPASGPVPGPPATGPSGSGPSGPVPSGSVPSGPGSSAPGLSGAGPSTGPKAVPSSPAAKPATPVAPPAGGDVPAGDRAPLAAPAAAAGRVPQPAPATRPGANAPGRRPSGGSGSAPTITSRPAGPRVAGTRPPTAQPPGPPPPAAPAPAPQPAAAHSGHAQPPGARAPGPPAGAYQTGGPPPNHAGAGPVPTSGPPARSAAAGPRPATEPPPVSAPPVSPSDDSANFDRLRSAAGALGVSKRAYRIGAGAEGAWAVLREGSKWAVFRTELGVRHDLASFTNSQHATAYLIGQLYLAQGTGAPVPDQARRPATSAPPATSNPPATSAPPTAAAARPAAARPAVEVPATTAAPETTATGGTAGPNLAEPGIAGPNLVEPGIAGPGIAEHRIAEPNIAGRPTSAAAEGVAEATTTGQPAAEKAKVEASGPADQAAKPVGNRTVSGDAAASGLDEAEAAPADAEQRAAQDGSPTPRPSSTARETNTSSAETSTKTSSAETPGSAGPRSVAGDTPKAAAANPDPKPAVKAGPASAAKPAPVGPSQPARPTGQGQTPAAASGTGPGPSAPSTSSKPSGAGVPSTSERAGRPAAVPDDRLGLKVGPPAGITAGALDSPTTGAGTGTGTGTGPTVTKSGATGGNAGRPTSPDRPNGPAHGPVRPDAPGQGSIFTPAVPAAPPAATAPRAATPATPAGGGTATPGPSSTDKGPAATGWSIQPLPGEPPLTLYRDKHPVLLKPDTEIDRYGEANGNVVYAVRTKYPQRSLPTEWSTFPYHVYRLVRPLEVLTGVAVPWFDQPGGGTVYVLPRSVAELLADGALVEVKNAVPNQ